MEKAVELYGGHFLPGEETQVWTTSYREKLWSKFLRLVLHWGEHLESAGEWQDAVDRYQRGLEMDELAEALYQQLICCYQQLGLRAEALAAYHRCREVLSRVLGVAPSPKTEALSRARMT